MNRTQTPCSVCKHRTLENAETDGKNTFKYPLWEDSLQALSVEPFWLTSKCIWQNSSDINGRGIKHIWERLFKIKIKNVLFDPLSEILIQNI